MEYNQTSPNLNKWPKVLPELTPEQQRISDDFIARWHQDLESKQRYSAIETFNHGYPVNHTPSDFLSTLEIGAGTGKHLEYEKLTLDQQKNYYALELRENMASQLRQVNSKIKVILGDCQQSLPFEEGTFDRALAIHVLEHLPNLPAALREIHRVLNKDKGFFSVVIPCEGGRLYSFCRKISAQRLFEKRYKMSYDWLISREHINGPSEIFAELKPLFEIVHSSYFPFLLPSVHLNVCIGITLRPRRS